MTDWVRAMLRGRRPATAEQAVAEIRRTEAKMLAILEDARSRPSVASLLGRQLVANAEMSAELRKVRDK